MSYTPNAQFEGEHEDAIKQLKEQYGGGQVIQELFGDYAGHVRYIQEHDLGKRGEHANDLIRRLLEEHAEEQGQAGEPWIKTDYDPDDHFGFIDDEELRKLNDLDPMYEPIINPDHIDGTDMVRNSDLRAQVAIATMRYNPSDTGLYSRKTLEKVVADLYGYAPGTSDGNDAIENVVVKMVARLVEVSPEDTVYFDDRKVTDSRLKKYRETVGGTYRLSRYNTFMKSVEDAGNAMQAAETKAELDELYEEYKPAVDKFLRFNEIQGGRHDPKAQSYQNPEQYYDMRLSTIESSADD
ncbi:hypothetical protein ACFQE1_01800 [Halobium palmae]|uniref:Uncharacterized protein n=1 Tax=Halobium palmae TaxID=1776492 RepID=A0ABD5RUQ1_9EURY